MIMGASTFPGMLVRGSRMRFQQSSRGLGDLMMDCEGPHPICSPLDQACIANWQNIVSSCQPVPPAAGLTRDLATSSPKFAAQLAAAGGDEMLALQAQGNPVLPGHPSAAWWGGPGASVAGNPAPYSSSHHNPGATPTNPVQQQVRINPTNLPIHPLDPRPPLRTMFLPLSTAGPGFYTNPPMAGGGLGRLRLRTRGFGQTDWAGNPVTCPPGTHFAAGACIQLCNQSDPVSQNACAQQNQAAWNAAGAAQAAGKSQYTDPQTGQVISFTPPMSQATWNQVTAAYAAATGAPPPAASAVTTVVASQPPAVVNPSPSTQLTTTGTSQASPTSVLNLSRGIISPPLVSPTGQVSTVGGVVSGSWFSDPSQDIITGLPNWALLVMGAAGLFMVVSMATKR